MDIFEALKLAMQHVLAQKMRSWLTLIGIFAGIAAVVSLVSLGQGMQEAINEQFASIGVNTFTIQGAGSAYGPPGSNAVGELHDSDVRLIERVSGIQTAIGRYIVPTKFDYGGEEIYSYAVSIPSGDDREIMINSLDLNVESGIMIDDGDDRKVVLGSSLANKDDIEITVGEKIEISGEKLRVVGILEREGNPFVDGSIIVTEKAIDDLFGIKDDYDILIVIVNNIDKLDDIKESVIRLMRKDRDQKAGEEDFIVSTPQDMISSLNSILIVIQVLLVGIAAISLIVGAIGIMNTMYTAVLERRSEIGIMKAIGARNADVLTLFILESGFLGMSGGFLGLLAGIGIGKSVEFGATMYFGKSIIQAHFSYTLMIGVLVFAFTIGALSGAFPAFQAAKMKIVDTFR